MTEEIELDGQKYQVVPEGETEGAKVVLGLPDGFWMYREEMPGRMSNCLFPLWKAGCSMADPVMLRDSSKGKNPLFHQGMWDLLAGNMYEEMEKMFEGQHKERLLELLRSMGEWSGPGW